MVFSPGERGSIIVPVETGFIRFGVELVEYGDICIAWGFFADAKSGSENEVVAYHHVIPGMRILYAGEKSVKMSYSYIVYENMDKTNPAELILYFKVLRIPRASWDSIWRPVFDGMKGQLREAVEKWKR